MPTFPRPGPWLALLALCVPCLGQCSGSSSLQRTLDSPILQLEPGTSTSRPVKLSQALGLIGGRVLEGPFIAGLEIRSDALREPTVSPEAFARSATLRSALRIILEFLPGYSCRLIAPGFVNVRPPGAPHDPTDPLNHPVMEFSWHNLNGIVAVLTQPAAFFSFLGPRIARGEPSGMVGVVVGGGGSIPDGAVAHTTLLGVFNHLVQLNLKARLRSARARHARQPRFLWGWYCVEGRVDPATGLRTTRWGNFDTAPNVPTRRVGGGPSAAYRGPG